MTAGGQVIGNGPAYEAFLAAQVPLQKANYSTVKTAQFGTQSCVQSPQQMEYNSEIEPYFGKNTGESRTTDKAVSYVQVDPPTEPV